MPAEEKITVRANWPSRADNFIGIVGHYNQMSANIAVISRTVPYQTNARFNLHDLFPSPNQRASNLENKFNKLTDQWKRETAHFSVIARRYEHPAYKGILEMGNPATALILKELRRNPDRWFHALQQLTGDNPAKDAINFYEAVDQWVSWGISKGVIE